MFADGERCFAHWSRADRAVVADLDDRAPGIGLAERADRDVDRYCWPHGLGHRTDAAIHLLEWAERLRLRLSHAYGHLCVGWITGGDTFEDCPAQDPETRRVKCQHADACAAAWSDHIHAGDQPCPGECNCYVYFTPSDHCPGLSSSHTVFDHLTLWEGPHGLRLGLGQPYHLGEPEVQILSAFKADPRISVQVLPPGNGWYHPSAWLVCVAGCVPAAGVAA